MPPAATVDDIRSHRDTALEALGIALVKVGDQIAQTTASGPTLDQLTRRNQDLMDQRAAIRAAATDEVLALPAVIAAATALGALSAEMKTVAQALPAAASLLTGAATVLSLGQQFADLIAKAQKL
jgi:hypothetical protein